MTRPIGYIRAVTLLNDGGVSYTIHDAGADRVPKVPEHSPFSIASLVKTLALRIRHSWVLVVIRANDKLDYGRLARACGVARSDIIVPPRELVETDLGVEVGGIGPIPPNDSVRVLFDTFVLDLQAVYCGVGVAGKTLEIGLDDLLRVTQGQTAPIVRET